MYTLRMLWQVIPGRFLDYEAMSQRAADVMLAEPRFIDGELYNSVGHPIRYLTFLNWPDWRANREFTTNEAWGAYNRSEAEAGRMAMPVRPFEAFERTSSAGGPAPFLWVRERHIPVLQLDVWRESFAANAAEIGTFLAGKLDLGSAQAAIPSVFRMEGAGDPTHVVECLGATSLEVARVAGSMMAALFEGKDPKDTAPAEPDIYALVTHYRR